MDLQHIRVERRDDHITDVVLDRPPVNALDERFIEELDAVAGHLADAGRTRVVVLSSAHDAFMVGADLNMMDRGWDHVRSMIQSFQRAVNRWERIPSPTIALLGGHALGAGCELALACDWIYASTKARFGQPEVNLGLVPGFGGTSRLVRRVGPAWAKELVLSGEPIDAETALRIGLANRVFEPEALVDAAVAAGETIAKKGPIAVALAKRVMQEGQGADLHVANALEQQAFGLVFASADRAEGMDAFLERRDPRFEGR